jgi:hypothetical protein
MRTCELDHHHAKGWVARRQQMTRKMSGGGWRDSSRVTRSACLPYPPQTRRAACRCAYQGRENGARLMGGSVRAGRQIGEGAATMAREKEERTVIERYKGGGGDDRSVDGNVEGSACC